METMEMGGQGTRFADVGVGDRANSVRRRWSARIVAALVAVAALVLICASSAFANAPNPTSVVVNEAHAVAGGGLFLKISGTWTWDKRVPNGAQEDCNDQRVGVGYAIAWGDNKENELIGEEEIVNAKGQKEKIKVPVFVGDAEDNWVHSVTQGEQEVDGPFKPKPSKVKEVMGPEGLPVGVTSAQPTNAQAEKWFSNCGPTAQSVVNGQTIGNSNPKEPTKGYPNGTWGPISHTYKTGGPFTICTVMYDPHGHQVGEHAQNAQELTAGTHENKTTKEKFNRNNDNSIEGNANKTVCFGITVPGLKTTPEPSKGAETGKPLVDKATISGGNNPQGSLTWKLYGPFSSSSAITESSCVAGKLLFTSGAAPVNGNGSYTSSPSTSVSETGFYQWVASYESSNSSNVSVSSACGDATEQVEVPEIAKFTIVKEQRIKPATSYTTSLLKGKVGETVEYLVTVENTGNVTLKFKPLVDAKCTTINPSGETELKVNEKETFTCEHVLAVGDENPYKNVATATGESPGKKVVTKESNEVEVEFEPQFTIAKAQRVNGVPAGYTSAKLTGKVGDKVEYLVTVTNTGNATIKFEALKDPKCSNIQPSGEVTLKPTEKQEYTCEHVLAVGDPNPYVNVAAIKGGGKEEKSKEVEVEFEPQFTIAKAQRVNGVPAGYTSAKLTGKVGDKVEYLVTVTNTGNTTIKFEALKDPKCTNIQPSGEVTLKPTEKQEYTCEHVLAVGDPNPYVNVAAIKGGGKEEKSKEVEVEFEPQFTIAKAQRVNGVPAGYTSAKLTGKVGDKVEYLVTVTNTGNTTIKFEALKDPKCSNIQPSGEVTLKPTEKQEYTCEHVLAVGDPNPYVNVAAIKGGGKEEKSKEVEVEFEPQFTIAKAQRVNGVPAGYTSAKLTGKVGDKVEYLVTVTNTGNTTIKFEALKDPKCSNIQPSGEVTLKPTEKQEYTCEHVLAVGDPNPYVNVAAIKGGGKEEKSKEVEVEFEPQFTIAKAQRVNGQPPGYTASLLKAKVGDKVEYLITVTNTGNTTINFPALEDEKCTNIKPSGTVTLKPTEKQEYTCEHVLAAGDPNPYVNVATIKGKKSPPVEVEFEPQFTIEKEQEIEGSKEGFTKEKLKGEVGQTVDYKIVATNTGNVSLEVKSFSDAKCDTGTIKRLPPTGSVPVGGKATWTCDHVLTSADVGKPNIYTNAATVTFASEGAGKTEVEKESNVVEVEVPAKPIFTIEKFQKIEGSGGAFTKAQLTGEVGQTVEYEIIIKNTGNTTLTFSGYKDTECESIVGEPTTLEPGKETTVTCKHTLTTADQTAGKHVNTATVTGTPPAGEGTANTLTSNEVVVVMASPCPTHPPSVHLRWHYSANGTSGSWSSTEEPICGKQNTFKRFADGALHVTPGTEIKTGYDFSIPGNSSTFHFQFTNTTVVFKEVTCVSGKKPSASEFTITIPNEEYTVTSQEWVPSGDQHSPLVFQGKVNAPDLCAGGELNLAQGAVFSTFMTFH